MKPLIRNPAGRRKKNFLPCVNPRSRSRVRRTKSRDDLSRRGRPARGRTTLHGAVAIDGEGHAMERTLLVVALQYNTTRVHLLDQLHCRTSVVGFGFGLTTQCNVDVHPLGGGLVGGVHPLD